MNFARAAASDAAVAFEAGLGAVLQLFQVPARLGDADDRDVEPLVAHEGLKGREDLLVGEIAGRAEEDEGVGAGELAWPPSASGPRRFFVVAAELEPHRRHELVGVFGLAARFEAAEQGRAQHRRRHAFIDRRLKVQRPSPESDTRPANFVRFWSARSAEAVRSSSHEPITLPRRQTSATLARSMS